MRIKIDVSLGELVDKITILKIKKSKIADDDKLINIEKELNSLTLSLNQLKLDGLQSLEGKLLETNTMLWEIEDSIREKEREKDFGEEFINLARAVYKTNDQRFLLKSEINQLFDSELKEVKSYESYD